MIRLPGFLLGLLCCLTVAVNAAPAEEADKYLKQLRPLQDSDFYDNGSPNPAKIALGQALFFDKILSGNLNTSCATCHHVLADTGDGLSLPVGEGARGLGVMRDSGVGADAIHERVPRNAPPLFNLGAKAMDTMFHDGRVELDATQPSGFRSPAGTNLPLGLDNVLAVQAMFPVTSATEMAGQAGENDIADAAAIGNLAGPDGVWEQLAVRLRDIPGYVDMFNEAYGIGRNDISYVHAANAIAAFEGFSWRADNTPFDRYLRGDKMAMSKNARRGMAVFYRKANCAACHSGPLLTDLQFHAVAMPQVGPGKGDGSDGREDFGRERVTGQPVDRYRFRTPPLRNVRLTGPWGHSGAYNSLHDAVTHMLNPVESLNAYQCPGDALITPSRADLDALDCMVQDSARTNDIAAANELAPVQLNERDIADLIDFLDALTDPDSIDLRDDIPRSSPSGLSLTE